MKSILYHRWCLTSVLFFIWLSALAQSPDYLTEMTVAPDGSGDFTRIQEAIDATKGFPDVPIVIHLKPGTYREKVRIYSWNTKLSLIGEDRASTIITYNDHFDKMDHGRNSTFHTYTLKVEANDFRMENVTVKNTAGPVGQAVALHVEGDRCSFINCSLEGNQDTMYLAGERSRHYFERCYAEGTTDFIFGEATVWFEDCEIHAKSDSYITAASTVESNPYGFVFHDCTLTTAPETQRVFLGRPWRKYARTVFLDCTMRKRIAPEGWEVWSNEDNEQTTFYAEFQSKGPGANPEQRAHWAHSLTSQAASEYTRENVLGDWSPGGK